MYACAKEKRVCVAEAFNAFHSANLSEHLSWSYGPDANSIFAVMMDKSIKKKL